MGIQWPIFCLVRNMLTHFPQKVGRGWMSWQLSILSGLAVMTRTQIARGQGLIPHRVTDIFCRSEPTDRRYLLLHMCLRQTEIRVKILGGLFLLADWRNIGGSRFSTRSTPDSCESQTGTFSINQTIVFKRTLTLLIDFFNVHCNYTQEA